MNFPSSCVSECITYMYDLCLQLLEYVGKGKSIVDVGLAQARRPLNTRFHYYELEITDAGEKCYIALGLARRVRSSLLQSSR